MLSVKRVSSLAGHPCPRCQEGWWGGEGKGGQRRGREEEKEGESNRGGRGGVGGGGEGGRGLTVLHNSTHC